jgi:hypothetical protein
MKIKQYLENRVLNEVVENGLKADARNFGKRCLDAYFKPRDFEKWGDGRVYEWLGVRYFQRAYNLTIGKFISSFPGDNEKKWIRNKSPSGLREFYLTTKVIEGIHLFAIPVFLLVPGPIGYLLNLFANIYPIISQRYNRARVQNLFDKKYGGKNDR